jgi:hypothetical protein
VREVAALHIGRQSLYNFILPNDISEFLRPVFFNPDSMVLFHGHPHFLVLHLISGTDSMRGLFFGTLLTGEITRSF